MKASNQDTAATERWERIRAQFFRPTSAPAQRGFPIADLFSSGNPPPPVEKGARSKRAGIAPERIAVGREYRPGFGWHWIVLAALLIAGVVIVLDPDARDRFLKGPTSAGASTYDVLLISGNTSDIDAVTLVTQARGHSLTRAANAASALKILEGTPSRITFVAIDGDLAGAKGLINTVKSSCPAARLVVLRGPRNVADVSRQLVDAGMN